MACYRKNRVLYLVILVLADLILILIVLPV